MMPAYIGGPPPGGYRGHGLKDHPSESGRIPGAFFDYLFGLAGGFGIFEPVSFCRGEPFKNKILFLV
jgi:hypothetical protein